MSGQLELITKNSAGIAGENQRFLTEQLITYLGNKRSLLEFISRGVDVVRKKLNREKISTFDVFSGSGVVSRFLKQYSSLLIANDLEKYSTLINRCYLTNGDEFNHEEFTGIYRRFIRDMEEKPLVPGFLSREYAPQNDEAILLGERVFYTRRNALYLDTARQRIDEIPKAYQKYLLAPLLSEASIHANTSGVFKGFYKNSDTGLGRFGGKNQDALMRIKGDISVPYPVFSNYSCDCRIYNGDSNQVCEQLPQVDLAYLDPPYNQHPYGSNYFMLNLILEYRLPESVSCVSGIPDDWNRSSYNKNRLALLALTEIVEKIKAKFLLISFNSEGFISPKQMTEMLERRGKLTVLETRYNTFRGSRNLSARDVHVKEYLYLLEK